MKIRDILPAVLVLLLAGAIPGCSNSRKITVDPPLDSTAVRNMLDSQRFTFIPRFVNPMSGRRRDLDQGYELSISKDSLISYLPYFGRGYIAPISPSDVDYDFTSTKFTYSVTPARRGWNISIKAQDQTYLRELYFRVFNNATASLTITSLDRSSISYDGYLIRRRSYKEEKKQ
jgi:hypothetical protein